MPCKTDTFVARTIGIDTGKNTLHLIGLDEKGTIVMREKGRTRPSLHHRLARGEIFSAEGLGNASMRVKHKYPC